MHPIPSLVLALLGLSLLASPLHASSDSREKQMLRRMQQQMQQVEQARAQVEQEKAAALADKDVAERALEKMRASVAAAKRQIAGERAARSRAESELKAAQAERDALKTKLAETEKQLADSLAAQRATAQTLAQTESVKKQTENQLATRQQELKTCQAHNGSLYTLSRELMVKYRDKSCQDALAQAEPFTGLKKVEIENLLEAWRDRADRERLSASSVNQP